MGKNSPLRAPFRGISIARLFNHEQKQRSLQFSVQGGLLREGQVLDINFDLKKN